MGISPTASSREIEVRPIGTPDERNEALRSALRARSIIAQLENDQLDESQGDAIERSYRCGHNVAVNAALDHVRDGREPVLAFVGEHQGHELARANSRGYNAGVRHVRYVLRIHSGLVELAHAPVIRTVELHHAGIDLRLKHALVGGDS